MNPNFKNRTPLSRRQSRVPPRHELRDRAPDRHRPTLQQEPRLPRHPGQSSRRRPLRRSLVLGSGCARILDRSDQGRLARNLGDCLLDAAVLWRRHGRLPLLARRPTDRDAARSEKGRQPLTCISTIPPKPTLKP